MVNAIRPTLLPILVALNLYSAVSMLPAAALSGKTETKPIIQGIVRENRLSDLRWPNFTDVSAATTEFYESRDYSLAWVGDSGPTLQARGAIEALGEADAKGLTSEDYDGLLWSARLSRIQKGASAEDQARFDVALTISLMRYISDLHVGRVNPRHLNFNFDVGAKKYDLADFMQRLMTDPDVKSQLAAVEPPFAGYKRTQEALQRYLAMLPLSRGERLPVPPKSIAPGGTYSSIPRLAKLLHLLGDLPLNSAAIEESSVYEEPLVTAVKHFQERHGLSPDGVLGIETLKRLNTPFSSRVEQLRLTLERWRWVPYEFREPPIVVNIPEFRLRAFGQDGKVGLVSKVIVGKAYPTKTPVFEKAMRFVVFRPYWNVPPGILRRTVLPSIRKDPTYLQKNGYEVTTPQGASVTLGPITDEILQQLNQGKLLVRQKPGPSNALGLIKLMFPNEYHVYLHSTSTPALFSQTRRDFSAGCIRVEKAAELAAWVLQDKPEWSLTRVQNAMQNGSDNLQINLGKPVPVLILYGTAVVDEGNQVHFFDDIYGHDAALEKALQQRYRSAQ